jgi:hypothetical protein
MAPHDKKIASISQQKRTGEATSPHVRHFSAQARENKIRDKVVGGLEANAHVRLKCALCTIRAQPADKPHIFVELARFLFARSCCKEKTNQLQLISPCGTHVLI